MKLEPPPPLFFALWVFTPKDFSSSEVQTHLNSEMWPSVFLPSVTDSSEQHHMVKSTLLNCFWLLGETWFITTNQTASRFYKKHQSTSPFFCLKNSNIEPPSSCIVLHRTALTSLHSYYLTIYLCINLAVLLSFCRSLVPHSLPLPWSICLSSRPFLCCVSLSIHPSVSLSLQGTWTQSNRSHQGIHAPPPRNIQLPLSCPPCTPLAAQTWQSISLSSTHTYAHFTLTCRGILCYICPPLFCIFFLFISITLSIRLCLPPCLLSVFPRWWANTVMFHLYWRASHRSTASLPQQQRTVPFHYSAY